MSGYRAVMTRYIAQLLPGGWGVIDNESPKGYPLPGVRYAAQPAAEKLADLLNATAEGEPPEIRDRLRAELDELRHLTTR